MSNRFTYGMQPTAAMAALNQLDDDMVDRVNTAGASAATATSKAAEAAASKTAAETAAAQASAVATNVAVVRHSLRPSLLLPFAQMRRLDPRITFTRTSAAWRTNCFGLIEIVASGMPRFDYDPVVGNCKGLLIEEQRTNLLTYSENFDNAAWIKSGATVIAEVATAPDGTQTVTRVQEDATAAASHAIGQTIASALANTKQTFTLFLKADQRRYVQLRVSAFANGSNHGRAVFDLLLGTVTDTVSAGTCTDTTAKITPLGGGWYRCAVTATADTVEGLGTIVQVFSMPNPAGSAVFTGDGVSGFYMWGAQLEAGAFATSYVPSTDTFTSRATTGTYIDSTGALATAAINVARMQYNPANLTIAPKLLLEAAATNSIRNNSMQGAVAGTPGALPTYWSEALLAYGVREVVGVGVDSSGIEYVDIRLSGTGSGMLQLTFEGLATTTAASGQAWAASAYVKLVGGSLTNISSLASRIRQGLAAGTFVADTVASFTPTSSTLSGQRVSVPLASANATTERITFGMFINTVGAFDITLRIGMPQLELNPAGFTGATSVIRTTTAAATRAADVSTSAATTRAAEVASMTGANFSSWYRQDEGTIVAFSRILEDVPAGSFPCVLVLSNGTAANRMILGAAHNNIGVYESSASGVLGVAGYPYELENISKITAFAYKLNDYAYTLNGAGVATDGTAAVPIVTKLNIGSGYTGAQQLNGHIARLAYYPKRLSNAELQGLTQP